MSLQKKPYLIIPKLIEQPTWGGTYIATLKHWKDLPFLQNKKIGQSYELYGQSKLSLTLTDSTDPSFVPELGSADTAAIDTVHFPLKDGVDYVILADAVQSDPSNILGPYLLKKTNIMPLLIKINQASGNSFQLHIKPAEKSEKWQPKPESWYYLEDGAVTFGIKEDTSVHEYQKACHDINNYMKTLSQKIKSGVLTVDAARKDASEYIKSVNPWQYVNQYKTQKHSLLDLSMGGLHHSWEEDTSLPYGNVVYEIQRDVMDPVSTIRSFDQGKIKDNGDIREIHIDDYFTYLDTDPDHNNIANMLKERRGNRLLRTEYYSMDILECNNTLTEHTDDSFCHLFVRDGDVTVKTSEGSVHLTQGHSCFLAQHCGEYTITAHDGKAVLLKSYMEI